MILKHKDALIAYAKMMNNLDSSEFESIISDDFCYESQAVFEGIQGKKNFVEYIRAKLIAISKANATVYAELANLSNNDANECVVIAQNDKSNLVATVLLEVKQNKVSRIDICLVPDPKGTKRTGIYPS